MASAYGWYPMSFGKFKGQTLAEIPASYLQWVISQCDSADDDLKHYIRLELNARSAKSASGNSGAGQGKQEERVSARSSSLPVAVDAALAAEIVREGRRALALRYHPDRGGDAEKMTRVNATADHMEKKLTYFLGIGGAM